jgi:hypothetical protein
MGADTGIQERERRPQIRALTALRRLGISRSHRPKGQHS